MKGKITHVSIPVKFSLFIVILILIFSIFSGCFFLPPLPEDAKWTVMVYLAAGNDLEAVGIQDINELELIGSTSEVNIVVQMDRIPFSALNKLGLGTYDDSSNNDWTGTRRYYITQDTNPNIINSKLIEDLGEKNMGDPETLKDFAQWAIQNYPAERYMLVLWNHGGGFRSVENSRDICWDYNFGLNSRITMPELEEAMAYISSLLGAKIDIVGMDACFMAMVEVAYQIKDYAQIMIASQAVVPGDGWQYDSVLGAFITNPDQNTEYFAAEIINSYYKQYSTSVSNVTLSAIDLNGIDNLAKALSDLAYEIINDHSTPKKNYQDARKLTQYYTGLGFEYIDLKDFLSILIDYTANSKVLSAIGKVNQLLTTGNIIISNTSYGASVKNSYGLSIYFPYYKYDSYYNYTNFAKDTLWDEMLYHLGY